MSKPATVCDFVSHAEEAGHHGGLVAVSVCRTHRMRMDSIQTSSTVLEDGTAWTLCPVGKIEYEVQKGMERLQRKLEEIEQRLREAFPERS